MVQERVINHIVSPTGDVVRLLILTPEPYRGWLPAWARNGSSTMDQQVFYREWISSTATSEAIGVEVAPQLYRSIREGGFWPSETELEFICHAFRCQGCRMLFVVTKFDDLHHDCKGSQA